MSAGAELLVQAPMVAAALDGGTTARQLPSLTQRRGAM